MRNINTAGGEFSGFLRNLYVFVCVCKQNNSGNVTVSHTDSKIIQVIERERMVTKIHWYVPFKVTVKASDREKLLKPDM